MKTIAITIDEETLARIDSLSGARGAKGVRPNRSEVVRRALREYVERRERQRREELDRGILAAHRKTLRRQAEALIAGQAKP